jgi:hypothetical protein
MCHLLPFCFQPPFTKFQAAVRLHADGNRLAAAKRYSKRAFTTFNSITGVLFAFALAGEMPTAFSSKRLPA